MVRSVLNTLASDSKLNIVSSPSLMVLNNQKASIQVGDQVPITTQQQQATATASTVVNNIEFRDTGVLLTVTPRVNAGGLVIMEIEQEVSDVAPETIGTLTPTIQQRKINSTVAVQSGETVVLGGLIRENKNRAASGLPLLYQIPVLGLLFGQSSDSTRRTELVVLITPRAVQDASDARAVTNEFRIKMESLKHLQLRGASTPAAGQISGKAEPASRLSTGGAPSLRFPTRLSRPVASTGGSREGQAASLRPVVARPYRRTIRDAPLELKFDANFSRRRAEAGAEAEVEATTGETHWLGAMFSRLFRRP